MLPRVKAVLEKGQSLFQKTLKHAKNDQKTLQYFSVIEFTVNSYAKVAASRVYSDHPALRNGAIKGYMLAWREPFLKDQREEDHGESVL